MTPNVIDFNLGTEISTEEFVVDTRRANKKIVANYTGRFMDAESVYCKGNLFIEASLYGDENGTRYDTELKMPIKNNDDKSVSIHYDTKSILNYHNYLMSADFLIARKLSPDNSNKFKIYRLTDAVEKDTEEYMIKITMFNHDYEIWVPNNHELIVDNITAIEREALEDGTYDDKMKYLFFSNGYRCYEYESDMVWDVYSQDDNSSMLEFVMNTESSDEALEPITWYNFVPNKCNLYDDKDSTEIDECYKELKYTDKEQVQYIIHHTVYCPDRIIPADQSIYIVYKIEKEYSIHFDKITKQIITIPTGSESDDKFKASLDSITENEDNRFILIDSESTES